MPGSLVDVALDDLERKKGLGSQVRHCMAFSFFKKFRASSSDKTVDKVTPFVELKSRLFDIGGVLVHRDETQARFALTKAWSVEVTFERYDPDFSISLLNHDAGDRYTIWILMQVFERLLDKRYGAATIQRQVEFLKNEGPLLFGNPAFYAGAYQAAVTYVPPLPIRPR